MTVAIIHLCPNDVLREISFCNDTVGMARENFSRYTKMPPISVTISAEDAAEEMFDLTNNPYRQKEREEKYGRGRSLSCGDVVEVDGDLFLCSSVGWEKM